MRISSAMMPVMPWGTRTINCAQKSILYMMLRAAVVMNMVQNRLMAAAQTGDGPFVYPVLTREGDNVGYVQLCMAERGWEVGYHIAKPCTGRGYATEALAAFLPFALDKAGVCSLDGIVLEENAASQRVLEKCGFELEFKGTALYQGEPRAVRRYVWPRKGMA